MPTVQQYGSSKVNTNVAKGARASTAPLGAFSTFSGGEQLARGIIDFKNRVDTTEAEEALVHFERDKNKLFFDPESGYFNTSGRNAYDAADTTNKTLSQLQKRYSDTLSSENAKKMFDKASQAHVTRGNTDIMRHSSKGLKAWEIATIESTVENTIENAALKWNSSEEMAIQNALGEQAVLDASELAGIGAEATAEKLQTYRSSFAKTAVTSAIHNSYSDGERLLNSMDNRLEPHDKIKLQKQLKAKKDSEQLQFNSQQAVLSATKIVNQHDDRSDVITQVNSISDPDLRKRTLSHAMYLINQNKRAESEERADAFELAESHLLEDGSIETFKSSNPESWEKLSVKQKSHLQSGKSTRTDWESYSDLMLLPKDQLAKIDPTDYYDKLAPAERSKLIAGVKSANRGSDSVDTQVGRSRIKQMSDAVTKVYGNKSKRSSQQHDHVDSFYNLVDVELRHREELMGRQLNSEEFTNLLSGMTRDVTIQQSTLGFDFLNPDDVLNISDIPNSDLPELTKFLRSNGLPVTADNLIKLYEQAK